MRGSIVLIVIGCIILSIGIYVQYLNSRIPESAVECTAVITQFKEVQTSEIQSTVTLVEYTALGQKYENVPLGQYEASWKIGDQIKIYASIDNPEMIWTKTMKYRGAMLIFLSVPFLTIGIYKIMQFKRMSKIGENESDTDKEEEIKYKRSSFIIPLSAGIPFTILGLFLRFLENDSILALVTIIMGGSATIVGVISLINFINIKLNAKKN